MTTDDVVLVDVTDRVAVVTLHRPEARNALNRAVRRRLPAVINELEADDDVDVVVLTGTDPAFCAGVDLKEFASGATSDAGEGFADMGARDDGRLPFRGALPPRTKLCIGAINGVAVTGGFELALACDFLVASERAREMSVTGNFIDAPTALAWGLVNHVVAHEELLPFCVQLGRDCASIDQRAVRRMLRTYDEVSATTIDEAWGIEDRVSREWEGGGFDPAEIEARRREVLARGRRQVQG